MLALVNIADSRASGYAHTNFEVMKTKYRYASSEAQQQTVKEEIQNRFDGNSKKTLFLAGLSRDEGDDKAANNMLQDAIKTQSAPWSIYRELGKQLVLGGEYEKGTEVFLSYSDFHNRYPDNPVALSNHAYDAGSWLFWRGEIELAEPLYRIAAKLKTGSGASLASALRLEIIEGNYVKAMQYARYTAGRYNDAYRYRDYLSFLSVLGEPDKAMTGFSKLSNRLFKPDIWEAAFIAQRLQGQSFTDTVAWINEKKLNPKFYRLASRYSILSGAVDRPVGPDLEQGIRDLYDKWDRPEAWTRFTFVESQPIVYLDDELAALLEDGQLTVPMRDGEFICVEDTSWYQWCRKRLKTLPPLDASFLSGYVQLRRGNNTEAYQALREHLLVYGNPAYEKELGSLVYPYLALAAAGTENLALLQRYLDESTMAGRAKKFDLLLVQAVTEASRNEIDASLNSLQQAFDRRPHTDDRSIFSYYQILEMTEFLFEMTDDRRYIDKGLEWATAFRVIQPQYSWGHSYVARYGREKQERIAAAGYSQYLDPQSAWLASVPKEIRVAGEKWWKANNPFNPKKPPRKALTAS